MVLEPECPFLGITSIGVKTMHEKVQFEIERGSTAYRTPGV